MCKALTRTAMAVACALVAFSAQAVEKGAVPREEKIAADIESEFSITKGTFAKLYNETVQEIAVEESKSASGRISVEPQLGMLVPEQLVLQNSYYRADYTQSNAAIPFVAFDVRHAFLKVDAVRLGGMLNLGYSHFQAEPEITSQRGVALKDVVDVHWLPVTAGGYADILALGVPAFYPSASAGVGSQWIYQVGQLDGNEEGHWMPFYHYGLQVTAFAGDAETQHWFRGVKLGATYRSSLDAEQVVRGWSYHVGAALAL